MLTLALTLTAAFGALLMAADPQEAIRRAEALRKEERYAEAAGILSQYLEEHGPDVIPAYEAACYHALSGASAEALRHLEMAIDAGWNDVDWLLHDSDLDSLHCEPRWSELVRKTESARDALLAHLPMQHDKSGGITLPAPQLSGSVSVEQAMTMRRSIRSYQERSLTLEQVSQLLWSAYGVTCPRAVEKLRGGFKTAPSAGACYPLEVYLAAWNVEGLSPGYYLYGPELHQIYPVRLGDFAAEFRDACHGQEFCAQAPASLVWSAVFSRNTNRYGLRGRNRYVPMDAGHSAQNVCLQAEALGLGTVQVGAFSDLRLQITVGMTRGEEPLYVTPVGYKG